MKKKTKTFISLFTITALTAASAANAVYLSKYTPDESVTGFEAQARDGFRWHSSAAALHANVEKLLGKKGYNGVHFAKDGYLIERPDTYNPEIVRENLDAAIAFADKGQYNISIAILPTAFEILRDKLPSHAYDDRIAKVLDAVADADDKIAVCDTRSILDAFKDDYICYRTDKHLNSEGSYRVYHALGYTLWYEPYPTEDFDIEILSENFRGSAWQSAPISFTKSDSIERYILPGSLDYTLEIQNEVSDDIYDLENKDSYEVFPGGSAVEVIHSSCGEARTLAVIKDSHANSIAPFLANHFKEVHLIDLNYFRENVSEYLNENEITDVLILYSAETFNTDTPLTRLN